MDSESALQTLKRRAAALEDKMTNVYFEPGLALRSSLEVLDLALRSSLTLTQLFLSLDQKNPPRYSHVGAQTTPNLSHRIADNTKLTQDGQR